LCKAQPMFLVMILFALCCRLLTMNCQNENKIRVNLRWDSVLRIDVCRVTQRRTLTKVQCYVPHYREVPGIKKMFTLCLNIPTLNLVVAGKVSDIVDPQTLFMSRHCLLH
jgi:hypothetical protein